MRLAGLAARRGPRAVRPLLRRALPGRLRPDPRDAGQPRSSAASWADLIRRIRRNPNSRLADGETLDPEQIAYPDHPAQERDAHARSADVPAAGSRFLRSLFSGLYTVDNMDFVLRDAYMSGYSTRAFDLDRLLHYSFFTAQGLTIHERGLSALVRFISRAGRTVSRDLLPPHGAGDRPGAAGAVRRQQAAPVPRQSAGASRRVSAVDRMVAAGGGGRLAAERRPGAARAGPALAAVPAPASCAGRWPASGRCSSPPASRAEQHLQQRGGRSRRRVREQLPAALRDLPLRVDTARHVHRPGHARRRRPARTSSTTRHGTRSAASTTASCSATSRSATASAASTPKTSDHNAELAAAHGRARSAPAAATT